MFTFIVIHLSFFLMALYLQHLTIQAAEGKSEGGPGLRTSATTASPQSWQRAHQAALPLIRVNSIVQLVANVLAVILVYKDVNPLLALNIPVVLMVVVVGVALSKAQRAANGN